MPAELLLTDHHPIDETHDFHLEQQSLPADPPTREISLEERVRTPQERLQSREERRRRQRDPARLAVEAYMADHHDEFETLETTPRRTGTAAEATPKLSWREHQDLADEAYKLATQRRQSRYGLDSKTVEMYADASSHFNSALFFSPGGKADNLSNSYKLASSLGWQAEAMEPGVFYTDRGSRHVDVKSNLQEIAYKTLRHANMVALAGEMSGDDDSLPEPIIEAAVEAAEESGTGNHVLVRDIGGVDAKTPERLEAEGKEAFFRFTGLHALDPQHGAEFTARMAEEMDTGIHNLNLPG